MRVEEVVSAGKLVDDNSKRVAEYLPAYYFTVLEWTKFPSFSEHWRDGLPHG